MDLLIALLPAIVMITLVIITRKVLLALGIGVVLAAIIHESYHPIRAVGYLWDGLVGILTSWDWYMPIIGFVMIIGGMTALLSLTGGIRAFARWSVSKVKNPQSAQLMTWILGLIIFIDDYFNALVIGEVSKPVTDEYKVSRAKLAYIIDSTSAPVVIMMPISTWGAYIIGIMGDLFSSVDYDAHTGFSGFLAAVPYQFYPMIAISMVLATILFTINFGPMRDFERQSESGNDVSKSQVAEIVEAGDVEGGNATHWSLIIPVASLIILTIFFMFLAADFNPAAFMDQEITLPLFFSGLIALAMAFGFGLMDKGVKKLSMVQATGKGMLEMVKSAVVILILAWMVSSSIQDLGVGEMVADIIAETNLTAALLPFVLFLIAAGIAFSTGTSWGAFGILLPIAIPLAMATNPLFMPAIVASVLGGAVVGDHSSPVSDTTVLSSTGAQSTLHAHFISQLPYVLVTAGIAALGYLLFGLTEILFLSYLLMLTLLIVFVILYKKNIILKEKSD